MSKDIVTITLKKLKDKGDRPFVVAKDAAVLVAGPNCEEFKCEGLHLNEDMIGDTHALAYRVFKLTREDLDFDGIEDALTEQEKVLGPRTTAKWNYIFSSSIDDSALGYNPADYDGDANKKPLPAYRVTPYALPEPVDAETWAEATSALAAEPQGKPIQVAILDLGREKNPSGELIGGEIGDTALNETTSFHVAAASPRAGHAVFVAGLIRRAAPKADLRLTFKGTIKARRHTTTADVMSDLAELFYERGGELRTTRRRS